MTQPHEERSVRIPPSPVARVVDIVKYLDAKECSVRASMVEKYTAEDVEKAFSTFFPQLEKVLAFQGVTTAVEAQDLILSLVAATVAYEYNEAPNLTLALSDIPFSRLLKVARTTHRFSVLEAPGKVRFVVFPGTHNYRTFNVNLRWGRVKRQQWTGLVDGLVASGIGGVDDDHYIPVHGGVRLLWEYRVHEGFSREADESLSQMEQLIHDVRHNGYRLVCTGHSLGGAVAQLVTFRMLCSHTELKDKLTCITFGTPLVGNYQLAQRVERCGWRSKFHHVVYRSDVVPRLSCADQITKDLADQLVQGIVAFQSSVQGWFASRSSGGEEPKDVAKEIDTWIKEGKDAVEAEDIPPPTSGHRTHRMYACFGRYHFLNHGGVNYFSTDDSEIAFHRLKAGCGGVTIVRDHSLSAYNRALMLHLYIP
ncbi:putative class 3 lipase [Trypanosoma grayi]|uniref:putative class 3 lipase n=1 Tax=Trypanosoma grayi TaxID=71804 RepID=UPI0004F431A2|nr:putative class 3 lipase [Trypanosoma grayi]KEG09506.1 putative class 3 lipase [Trypanosoma grayi]